MISKLPPVITGDIFCFQEFRDQSADEGFLRVGESRTRRQNVFFCKNEQGFLPDSLLNKMTLLLFDLQTDTFLLCHSSAFHLFIMLAYVKEVNV